MIPKELDALKVPIGDLRTLDGNPRQGDVGAIVTSLEANGQYRPIVVNKRDMTILAGNHTYRAAMELGWSEIAVTFVDVDESEARRIVLVDNRLNDLATYDEGALEAMLLEIARAEGPDGLIGTGFDGDDLDDLLADLDDGDADPDDVPDPPVDPVSVPGDVWQLGDHVLVCGDSTSPDTYRHMPRPADLVWTDPPYGVSYEGKTKDALTIKNDGADGLAALLEAAIPTAWDHAAPGAPFYVAAPAGLQHAAFVDVLRERGWRQTLIWVKNTMVLGHSDYHYRHEPIFYGFVPGGKGRRGRGGEGGWHADNSQTTVFEFDKPSRNRDHPTMKPVELVEQCLRNSSTGKSLVMDVFGGSGTTLIAAERLGRQAFLIELDPVYCDVICRRYQELTGVLPVRKSDGEAFDFSDG